MRRIRSRALVAIASVSVAVLGVVLPASTAQAAGTPSGPQYAYRMTGVAQYQTKVQAESLSAVDCLPSGHTGTDSYSVASTKSNTFSVTSGVDFSGLIKLLTAAGSVSVSSSTGSSTTITQTLTVSFKGPQCAQVFALRDRYVYNLEKYCNWACSADYYSNSGTHIWVSQGQGVFSQFVARKYYIS